MKVLRPVCKGHNCEREGTKCEGRGISLSTSREPELFNNNDIVPSKSLYVGVNVGM